KRKTHALEQTRAQAEINRTAIANPSFLPSFESVLAAQKQVHAGPPASGRTLAAPLSEAGQIKQGHDVMRAYPVSLNQDTGLAALKPFDDKAASTVARLHRHQMIRASRILVLSPLVVSPSFLPQTRAGQAVAAPLAAPGFSLQPIKAAQVHHQGEALFPGSRDRSQEENRWLVSKEHPPKGTHALPRLDAVPADQGYALLEGSYVPAVLVTRVDSDLPGPIEARVSENVYDSVTGDVLLIPAGSLLVGSYDNEVYAGQERIMSVFSRLVFPNGTSVALSGLPAVDNEGAAGLKDEVRTHFWTIFGSGMVIAEIAHAVNGNPAEPQTLVSGAGTSTDAAGAVLVQTTHSMLDRNLSIAPTITLRPGHRFNLFVRQDLHLAPYRSN
ncbi:MAG: TrbI/VirB10 family protein, partial [Pseudomonadota bacterium]|nr:TrbI/VirB10 family protein [Pseudomonadota bacterium]